MIPFRPIHPLSPEELQELSTRLAGWAKDPSGHRAQLEREAWESALQSVTLARYAIAVPSPLAAVTLALEALQLPPDSDVVVYTPTAALAATQARLRPRLVPSRRGPTDCRDLRAALSAETRAVVAWSAWGERCDFVGLESLAQEKGLWVLEEGSLGLPHPCQGPQAACIGFGPLSPLPLHHPSGIVLTQDGTLAQRLRSRAQELGWGADPVSCWILRQRLPRLGGWLALRRSLAYWYLTGLEPLVARGLIQAPSPPERPEQHTWETFVIRTPNARALREALGKRLIETQALDDERLALPLYPQLGGKEIAHVVTALTQCLRGSTISSSISL